jgi:tetratricopeptide (TPR) repeat protein
MIQPRLTDSTETAAMWRGAVVLWTVIVAGTAFAASPVDDLRREVYRQVVNQREDRALPVAKELLAATEKEFGSDHLETASSLDTLGDRWSALRVHAEAEESYRRALAIREKVFGPEHSEVAVSLMTLAYPLEDTDRDAEAYRLCHRALSILGKAKGHDHPATAIALGRMRGLKMAQGKTAEAGIFYERERAILEQVAKAEPVELPIRAAPDATPPSTPLSGDRLWSCHCSFAMRLFAGRDYEAALFHFVQAARLRPEVSETHYNVGVVLEVTRSHAEAVKAFAEAWRLQPDVTKYRFHLAKQLGFAERFDESEMHLKALLADDPNNPLYHNFLGIAVYRAGRRAEGVAEFHRALTLAPGLPEATEALAIVSSEVEGFIQQALRRRDAGREAEAIADLATALEIDPDNAEALIVRAQMLMANGNAEQATADIERVINNGTERPEPFSMRAHLRQDRSSKAERLADLTRAVELGPDCFLYPLNRGLFHANVGDWDRAYSDFATAHELAPEESEPLVNLAAARINRGCFDTALEACQQVLDRQPSHAHALYNRGVALAHLGRREDALRDLLEAKQLDQEWTAQADEIIARFRLKQQSPGSAK